LNDHLADLVAQLVLYDQRDMTIGRHIIVSLSDMIEGIGDILKEISSDVTCRNYLQRRNEFDHRINPVRKVTLNA
jgi:hypothetical protein